ncbi:MAG TPA: DUF6064 family protein [Alphaproteobacteria bacterium]|nr:DUF6064 family protein [Alphaproteobacteria bacterium]
MPFTEAQFFAVFQAWNAAAWPAQPLAYALAAVTTALALAGAPGGGRLLAGVLAAMWLANGLGYHLVQFSRINPLAPAFAALFVLQAGLLVAWGVLHDGLRLRAAWRPWPVVGLACLAYAAVIYPLIGLALGRDAAALPWLGIAPCPTVIYSIGVLLLARPVVPAWLFAGPLAWAAIGGSAAVLLRVPQDWGLLAAGLLAAAHLLRRDAPLKGC